ncbi:MAG TPA: hypothetical protein VFH95_08565 [Candidatus Kapabacteria bacterium]|nr:hypothetical protein [Candidatus Kapabacteria bacterium]
MNDLTERVRRVLEDISRDNDGFDFAAIIEREDADGRWDLVVSAPWINDEFEFLKEMAPKLTEVLADRELFSFGKIVVLDPQDEFMQSYNQLPAHISVDHDLFNITIAGIPIRHAHVFGSEVSFTPA